MPTRLSEDKSVKCFLDFPYFCLASSQRDYVLSTEADLRHCSTGSIALCTADVVLSDVQTLILSPACSYRPQIATAYAVGTSSSTTKRLHYNAMEIYGRTISWNVKLPYAVQGIVTGRLTLSTFRSRLHIHVQRLDMFHFVHRDPNAKIPELHKTMKVKVDTTYVYLPDRFPIDPDHEAPQIEEAMSPEAVELDNIRSRLVSPQRSFDTDTLLHVRRNSLHAESSSYWLLAITATSSTFAVLLVLHFSLRCHFRRLILRRLCTTISSEPNVANQASSPQTPDPECTETETRNDNLQRNVTLTTYSLQQTN